MKVAQEGGLSRARVMCAEKADMTKILLVDDSKFLRMATERALVRVGYNVITGADGSSALALARTEKPDLILLDMLLPKITGPDVLKALKKDPATATIAVVALTGLSQKMPPGSSRMEHARSWKNQNWGWTRDARPCCWLWGKSCGNSACRFPTERELAVHKEYRFRTRPEPVGSAPRQASQNAYRYG
jgi:CheY-like chemotaxis protein